MDDTQRFDTAWALRALHQVAVGISQLHGIGAAHQDIKPSNVLVFSGGTSSKLGDLGRATLQRYPAPHDNLSLAGDPHYAPPEFLYGAADTEWASRRMGCDLYHLGSLIAFFFSAVSMTALLLYKLDHSLRPTNWNGSYPEILPYLSQAFTNALTDLAEEMHPEFRDELVSIVAQLCEPDPKRRGHPKEHSILRGNRYSVRRYVTRLDLLARRAEVRLRQ
jgi:serine/threonine protein kinase